MMKPDYIIDYTNESEYKKLERALKKYNMIAFNKLNSEYYPALRNGNFAGERVSVNKKDNTAKYELTLPGDKAFTTVHGMAKLHYTVDLNEKKVMLDTITPTDILLEGHMSELATYKGIMISKANASKDKFKIDLLNILNDSGKQQKEEPQRSENEIEKEVVVEEKKETISSDRLKGLKTSAILIIIGNVLYWILEYRTSNDINPFSEFLTGVLLGISVGINIIGIVLLVSYIVKNKEK